MQHKVSVIFLILQLWFNYCSVNAFNEDDDNISRNYRNGLQLELAQVVYRHGDRNPVEPYPTDPYRDESFWPEGFGQLTKIGKQQQFELGKYIRQRYKHFLSDIYSPYEILVQSSNIDRAISSAESNLAGLYPPTNDRSIWNPEIKWQPVPVHTQPESMDNKLNMKAPCPRYDELEKEFLKTSEELKQINENNKLLYEILTNHTGEKIGSPKDVDYINDVLFIERLYHMSLPDWTKLILPQYQNNLTSLSAFSFKMISYTPEMQKFKGGPLLKEIIQHMKNKTSSAMDPRRKLFMYSGHDTTVAALLNVMDVFDVQCPPYRSIIFIDLYSNASTGEYFVEVSYRNNTNEPPYIMQLPGCDAICPLGEFIELTKSKLPNNWEQDCKSSRHLFDVIGLIVTGLVALLTLGLFVCLGMLFMSYLKNKRRGGPKPPVYPYLHLQMEDGDDCG